jgi:hypothetical protein
MIYLSQPITGFLLLNQTTFFRTGQQHGSSCSGRTNIGGLLVIILYICFSIGSGSGLDVFQIPQHRKALFVRL